MSNTFVTPWTIAHQAPLSIAFPRQEYWTGLPFPSPGDLPDPGIKPASPALAGRLFTIEPPGKPQLNLAVLKFSHYSRKNKQNKQTKKQAKQSKTIPQVKTKSQYPYPHHVLFESPSIHLHIHSCSQHHFMSCLLLTCYFKLGSQDSIKLSQCPKSFMWSKIFKALLISRKFLEVFHRSFLMPDTLVHVLLTQKLPK